jgi:hypothetical protein
LDRAGGNEGGTGPGWPDMANIPTNDARAAIVGRAAFVGGFMLALIVWLQCQPPVQGFAAVVSLESVKRPPVIVPMELDAPAQPPGLISRLATLLVPSHPSVVTPGKHPDEQPWPRGMVIAPPPFPDRMPADIPSALDRTLSALLAPWITTAS